MKLRSILVPVDFSDDSREAFDVAVELALDHGARLHLLHCYPVDLGLATPYGVELPPDFAEALRSAAAEQMHEWHEIATARGVDVEAHLTPRSASDGIEHAVSELDIDWIVMGTRGLAGLKHVLLGSVAERTVRRARCPVLTVKASEKSAS